MIKTLEFNVLGDERGSLVSLEENGNIPFNIRRVYYIFDTETEVSRGFHAHRELEQIAVCLKGRCRFVLDDGHTREEVWLDSPNKGLYINNNKWREMHDFSDDCVLMVLASNVYDESDYIRDYEEFLKEVNG
ncbi:sugar 3,4-ketoisomerase [Vibrio genomosp. F10 str. 9ZC157]|uniref:dTDP-6-deoxy-3,4-keto-hexulose isomerase n=1 Tax=Vibrio genomosp. F10 str. ZF-129 TaxID=1187848 RepID=A0A1E5BDC8_9VIBR|nr:FdtA/QdtA family cupin domain-containing protein [Vibrio genomosp. F10]OEE33130.1 dTDP-6-deoxy-3,4-keto-hexulose isomerase [Vibrio genomosp. F10 str. ZF-129]OEE95631.1 dTDP-6-deoxy-3,4-keto-hexulose isomerase [Vibrio genomosp. F10 str. 9ZC157]